MQNGIYHVRFASDQDSGEGLAVIQNGTVNGGDNGYLYLGRLHVVGNTLSGLLEIKRWNAAVPSVFGPLGNFKLLLTGSFSGATFEANGSVEQRPQLTIKISGNKISDPA